MNAVIETNASAESNLDDQGLQELSASSTRSSAKSLQPARLPLRQAKQNWNSTLCAADLQSLLQIIETDLIPQMVNGYSAARYAPDDRLTSG